MTTTAPTIRSVAIQPTEPCASPDCSRKARTWPDGALLCIHHRRVGIEVDRDDSPSHSEFCEERSFRAEMLCGERGIA